MMGERGGGMRMGILKARGGGGRREGR